MEEDTVTVISNNIHHGAGVDKKLDLKRIANVIKREDPDIVAFQEVDVMATRSGRIDKPKILGQLTGYKHFFGKAIPIKGGEYGNAIIAKDREAPVVKHIPLPGKEPRCMFAFQAKRKNGTPYILACTHLALEDDCFLRSTEIISDWVKDITIPSVFVGDMNCTTISPIYISFTQTWDARKPRSAIDHCFTFPKQAWQVKDIKVVEEPVASDHRPLKVTLVLK